MSSAEYTSISQEESQCKEQNAEGIKVSGNVARIIYVGFIIVLACSMIDILALIYLASASFFQPNITADNLPVGNTYIGLEDLYQNKNQASVKSIINFPKVLQLVNSSQPNTVFPQWYKTSTTPHGVISVNERRLSVTGTCSILVYVDIDCRPIPDFGLWNGEMRDDLALPFHNNNSGLGLSPERIQKPSSRDFAIDVWSLRPDLNFDAQSLTWRTMPQRDKPVGSFWIADAQIQRLEAFPCRSGVYMTFEMVCAESDCDIDQVVTGDSDKMGTYISGCLFS
ncbi:hypothetical protein C8J56DRAFT_903687 [Mycena floridula]|nr:hypothetical protein C8J56DRAFT_903687 [Mycena floridula]